MRAKYFPQSTQVVYYSKCNRCSDLAYVDAASGQCLRCKADEVDRMNCASGIRSCTRSVWGSCVHMFV